METEIETDIDEMLESLRPLKLVLYNDDVNSFDHVIYCLCKYLKIDSVQAEQIALIVHTKGKCIIKEDDEKTLLPIRTALIDNQLNCEIEK